MDRTVVAAGAVIVPNRRGARGAKRGRTKHRRGQPSPRSAPAGWSLATNTAIRMFVRPSHSVPAPSWAGLRMARRDAVASHRSETGRWIRALRVPGQPVATSRLAAIFFLPPFLASSSSHLLPSSSRLSSCHAHPHKKKQDKTSRTFALAHVHQTGRSVFADAALPSSLRRARRTGHRPLAMRDHHELRPRQELLQHLLKRSTFRSSRAASTSSRIATATAGS